jgi:transposase-like protein
MTKLGIDVRVRRSREQWRTMLLGFASSGLSAEAYCRREGISSASFYRWRTALGNGGAPGRPVMVRNAPPAFVDAGPLALPRAQPLSRHLDLRLDLGDGLILHLVRS